MPVNESDRPLELQYAIYIMDDIDEYSSYTHTYDFPEEIISYLKCVTAIIYKYIETYNVAKRAYGNCNDLLNLLQPLKIISKKAIEIYKIEKVA